MRRASEHPLGVWLPSVSLTPYWEENSQNLIKWTVRRGVSELGKPPFFRFHVDFTRKTTVLMKWSNWSYVRGSDLEWVVGTPQLPLVLFKHLDETFRNLKITFFGACHFHGFGGWGGEKVDIKRPWTCTQWCLCYATAVEIVMECQAIG